MKSLAKNINSFIRRNYYKTECFTVILSYYRYHNEQRDRFQKFIKTPIFFSIIEIILYNSFIIAKIARISLIQSPKKLESNIDELIYYENVKYLDVVNEIGRCLKLKGRKYTVISKKEIEKYVFRFSVSAVRIFVAQIKSVRDAVRIADKEIKLPLALMLTRDLLYSTCIKTNLKVRLKCLHTTNYICSYSIQISSMANKVLAYKRGLTGVGPELLSLGVDVVFVKNQIEKKLFDEYKACNNTVICEAFLYDETPENCIPVQPFEKTLLYLTQPVSQFFSTSAQFEEINFIINTAAKIGFRLIIKPHPSDKYPYKKFINDNVTVENNLQKAINNCSIGITKFSGTGLLLLKCDRKLVLLNSFHTYPDTNNFYFKAGYQIKTDTKSHEELGKIIINTNFHDLGTQFTMAQTKLSDLREFCDQ